MFREQRFNAGDSGTTLQLVQRRIAFTKGDGVIPIAESGEHFPKTPHSALVEWIAGKFALEPNIL